MSNCVDFSSYPTIPILIHDDELQLCYQVQRECNETIGDAVDNGQNFSLTRGRLLFPSNSYRTPPSIASLETTKTKAAISEVSPNANIWGAIGSILFGFITMGGCLPSEADYCKNPENRGDVPFKLDPAEAKKICKITDPSAVSQTEEEYFKCGLEVYRQGRILFANTLWYSLWKNSSDPSMKAKARIEVLNSM